MFRTVRIGAFLILLCIPNVMLAQTASMSIPTSQDPATTTSKTIDQYNPDDVEAVVRASFQSAPLMVAVARCESDFRQFDSYGNPLYGGSGGMVGVFQEAAAVHQDAAKALGFDINTLSGNLGYAHYLYDTEGLTPWLGSSSCWSPLNKNLKLGSSGSAVVTLQKILNQSGFLVAASGPGSPGEETTTFGPATRAALQRFQCDSGIICKGSEKTTGYGAVGSHTRLALLALSTKVAATSTRDTLSER